MKQASLYTQAPQVLKWRKSTQSNSGAGQCVEVGAADTLVAIRDSKYPAGGMLTTTTPEWTSLILAIDSGDFALKY